MTSTIKKELTGEKLSNLSTTAFIDCSGSTSTNINSKTILHHEIFTVNQIDSQNMQKIFWESSVSSNNEHNVRPSGGTSPTSIFKNAKSLALFESSEVIIICTDGEIDSGEISRFSINLSSHTNKGLYICIITNYPRPDLGNVNFSVVSPLMTANNMLCIYYDGSNSYIIASKGPISAKYPNPTNYNISNLAKINMGELNSIIISSQRIPPEYVVLSETEEEYKVINKNTFLSDTLPNLSTEEWTILIQYCLVNNLLPQLRTSIDNSRNKEILQLQEELSTFKGAAMKAREEIIEKMTDAFINKDIDLQKVLKTQLDAIKIEANAEEIAYIEFVNSKLNPVRGKYSMLRDRLFQIENSNNKYNLNNFASNRANRATNIVDDDTLITRITHENVPHMTCAICMDDNAPATLWLNKVEDVADTTSDYCIDFPLNYYPKLESILVPNPVCGSCANPYFAKMKTTIYRTPTIGYIPLNWDSDTNLKFAMNVLCKAFTEGKYMNHVKMLFLSVVDDCNKEWFLDTGCKDFIVQMLLKNIITTDTLTEEGNKGKLYDVIPSILKNSAYLFRQPISAVCRLIGFAKNMLDQDTLQNIYVRRFVLAMFERYSFLTKNESITTNNQIEKALFETICGIPVKGVNYVKECSVKDLQFLFGPQFNTLISFASRIGFEELIKPSIINAVLYHMSTLEQHERPVSMFTSFEKKNPKYLINLLSDVKEHINHSKFGKYIIVQNEKIPSYAIYNGNESCPSKLWFHQESLFDNISNGKHNINDLSNMLQKALCEKMITTYASYYPNGTSPHVMLHKIVATVIEQKYPNETEISTSMIISCMKKLAETNGNYGDIYKQRQIKHIIVGIIDFLKIRKTINYGLNQTEMVIRSTKHKLMSELNKYGMYGDGDYVQFDKSKIIMDVELLDINQDVVEQLMQKAIVEYNSIVSN
jgi:hypothetical protein